MPHRNLLTLVLVGIVSVIYYWTDERYRYGWVLVDAMDQIERRYLEPVDRDKLDEMFEGAIEGAVKRLRDQNSAYFPPRKAEDFRSGIEGKFDGIGISISFDPETGEIMVLSPLVGTPATEAGIRPGDRILAVDGKSTEGMSMDEAVGLMRGEVGDPVTLTILHKGEEEPLDLKIVRKIIRVESVLGDTREPDGSWNWFLEGRDRIGYVRIIAFRDQTPEELRRALDRLLEHGVQALILDLRGNSGGLLEEAVEVCDMFIESGQIVTLRRRDESVKETHEATQEGTLDGFPMAVLVNEYSASASEIVAACLQDYERAKIVGQRTYGKGTVQEIIYLEDGRGALKLTTAGYWRPSGENIHRGKEAKEEDTWGVKPDEGFEIVIEDEEARELHRQRQQRDLYQGADNGKPPNGGGGEPVIDRQLDKAIEYLEQEIRSRR